MAEVFFYHLTQSPLEGALRLLVEKSLGAGWRVAVRGRTDAMLDRLDAALWLGDEAGFLPHGRAGGAHDADQPVLLTTGAEAANRPDCVLAVEGAEIATGELASLKRAMVLFDGYHPQAVQGARDQWRLYKDAGVKAKYWSEESGRWTMKAET
ncbi:DNA polymerase III subunit chi [Roseicyclus mahoneyensis]|uniref:DNA polymerase III chi subunit n=1 Tax=Roseicyclus mahoneyensis TaxID=164332 RepID=A0A316GHA0_9RHOB|nr:DNA polymerase III subunit chi [Roseicyclus mahoneyensis]PWK60436.1 DNA polymerase III chi subunit [Roseicyclus mahoneyensis]